MDAQFLFNKAVDEVIANEKQAGRDRDAAYTRRFAEAVVQQDMILAQNSEDHEDTIESMIVVDGLTRETAKALINLWHPM